MVWITAYAVSLIHVYLQLFLNDKWPQHLSFETFLRKNMIIEIYGSWLPLVRDLICAAMAIYSTHIDIQGNVHLSGKKNYLHLC